MALCKASAHTSSHRRPWSLPHSGSWRPAAVLGYGDEKVANRDTKVWHGATEKRSLNDGKIQNPSNPFGIVPLSNFVPRGFGFFHHSIAVLYHEVPNPNLTIRNFFVAAWGRARARRCGAAVRRAIHSAAGARGSAGGARVRRCCGT
jgi:hypothetical protein